MNVAVNNQYDRPDSPDPTPDLLRQGLVTAVSALLVRRHTGHEYPAPLALTTGDRIAFFHGIDATSSETRAALRTAVAECEVNVVDAPMPPLDGNAPPPDGVKLAVAAHHSAALTAQRRALSWDVPVLLPGYLAEPTDQARVCLRPDTVLVMHGVDDGTTGISIPVVTLAQIPGPLHRRELFGDEHACGQLYLRPVHGSVLTYAGDGDAGSAFFAHGPQFFRLPTATELTVDDQKLILPAGRYRVSPADRPLYRLHAETLPPPKSGKPR